MNKFQDLQKYFYANEFCISEKTSKKTQTKIVERGLRKIKTVLKLLYKLTGENLAHIKNNYDLKNVKIKTRKILHTIIKTKN